MIQDNTTCHVARQTLNMLHINNINVIPFPAKSPDLNPIEHVWDLLKRRVRALPQALNLGELERNVLDTWQHLEQQDFRNIILSMRSRCDAVTLLSPLIGDIRDIETFTHNK